jgi:hypothetical protein
MAGVITDGGEYSVHISVDEDYLNIIVDIPRNHQESGSRHTIDGKDFQINEGIIIESSYICVWDERPVDDDGMETEASGSL